MGKGEMGARGDGRQRGDGSKERWGQRGDGGAKRKWGTESRRGQSEGEEQGGYRVRGEMRRRGDGEEGRWGQRGDEVKGETGAPAGPGPATGAVLSAPPAPGPGRVRARRALAAQCSPFAAGLQPSACSADLASSGAYSPGFVAKQAAPGPAGWREGWGHSQRAGSGRVHQTLRACETLGMWEQSQSGHKGKKCSTQ